MNTKILNMLCDGKTHQEIADHIGRNIRTVEGRIVLLRAKNHCKNTSQLIHKYTLFAYGITQNFYL